MPNTRLHSQAMHYLFYPRSIAIVGASPNPSKAGGTPLHSLRNNGYDGDIYPVNPNYTTIHDLPCYPSLQDIQGPVDLAVIAVPAPAVINALQQCADKKVKAAVVLTSGFAEIGGAGIALQEDMARLARENDIALCGPNCMGVFNAQNGLTAGFVISELPKQLTVPNFFGFVSQSGGFGAVMHAITADRGIGFTYFISSGNECVLQFADYLDYMVEDAATKVIGGYLEGIKDGRKLFQAAEKALLAQKPVILIKTGRHPAAAKAVFSHTGALAGADRVYNAFFKQKGIIRAEGVDELDTMLSILAGGGLPRGNRAGIIVGSGGNGALLADKCEEAGLRVATFAADTQKALSELLPSFGTAANPVDMTTKVLTDASLLKETTLLVLKDPGVDLLIIMHWSSPLPGQSQPTREIVNLLAHAAKPVVVLVWGTDESALADLRFFRKHRVAAVREIDYATRSLAALAQYAAKAQAHSSRPAIQPEPAPDREKTALLLKKYPPGCTLSEAQSREILSSYSIPVTRGGLAANEEEAVKIAAELGCPVVLKIDSPDLPHKTEIGGVKLSLDTPDKIKTAYREIIQNVQKHRPHALIRGVQVQEMLSGGIEAVAGISRDPVFGPIVLFGLGGIWVEALEDVTLRVAPLTAADAEEMLSEIKGARVLSGLRGRPPADQAAIIRVLLKLSQLALDFPEINELDINPLFVFREGRGVLAADALISIK